MQARSKLLAIPFALALGACGDDPIGPGEIELADLVGTWRVTQAEFRQDNGDDTYDLIDDGNASGTLTITNAGGGAYTLAFTASGGFTLTETGTIQVSDNAVTFTPTGGVAESVTNIEVSDDGMSIFFENATWDFNEDGDETDPEDSADLQLELERVGDDNDD